MKNRVIFIFFLFMALVFLPRVILADEPAKRALEIVYPQIPGVETPKYVSSGLPDYVNYIFRFAVVVIGILIFGVLIYSGINYLLSFGNPTKLSDAKQGMVAAGFSGLILLGAYLIFNTINPQLLILTPPEPGMLKSYIVPGVYICNYKVGDIGEILSKYTANVPESPADARENALKIRTEAAKRLKNAMGKAGDDANCFLAYYSGILTNFVIGANSTNWTLFIIPSENYNSETRTYDWGFNHGIVFHENDKFGGKCKVFPFVLGDTLYRQISDFHPQLGFDAKSVTVFQKPAFEPDPKYKGVSLYEGPAFNEIGKSGETGTSTFQQVKMFSSLLLPFFASAEVDVNLKKQEGIKSAGDIKKVTESELDGWGLKGNTRSIKIEPKDSYIAILLGDNGQKCEVRKSDDANLTDDPIGRCGACNIWAYINPLNWFETMDCKPCLESLYVIKGQVL